MPGFGSEWMGRLDPDGRFALWRAKKIKSYKGTTEQQRVYEQASEDMSRMREFSGSPVHGETESYMRVAMLSVRLENEAGRVGCSEPEALGSSKQFNSAIFRKPRGSGGITPHGRRIVRNGCAMLEARYGKDYLSFFTGTFPTMAPEEEQSIRENWSTGLNNFCKKVQRILKSKGLCPAIVGCVEVQEKRSKRTGAIGLHVHLVWHGRKKGKAWALTPKKLEKLWRQTWKNYLKESYVWNAAVQVVRIVKSASSYLGKYLSKGSESALHTSSLTGEVTPLVSSWYVCSRFLRRWIYSAVIKGESIGEYLRILIRERNRDILYIATVDRATNDGRMVPVCYFGTTVYRNYNGGDDSIVDKEIIHSR